VGFLNPWFLAGVAAVGLPVWLHLLRRNRQTPQPFSSLMFFEQRQQSSVRHRRLRHLILLALRCALIILLAFAFANPFIEHFRASAARKTLNVIVVDRSFSMRYGSDLEQAKTEAKRIVNGLPGRSLTQVLAADSRVETLTQPQVDRAVLILAINSIEATDEASSFGELSRALRSMDQNSGMRLNVHFISDMQQSSMPQDFRDLQAGPNTSLALHRVGERSRPNWAVEKVTGTSHVYDPKRTRVSATIAGWNTPATTRTVALYIDGKCVASKEITLAANGAAQVSFDAFDVPYGFHRGQVRIQPGDQLNSDDGYPFALERSDPRKVLFLYAGRPQESFYYRAAIESTPDTGLALESAPMEQAAGMDLSKFAYLVLNDPGELDTRAAQAICAYVSRGGAVFIALGHRSETWGKVALSGDRIQGQHNASRAAGFNPAEPSLEGAAQLENVSFLENGSLHPKPTGRVIAKLEDGSPLLVQENMGEGKELVFSSSMDLSTSDFPLHTSWVPFVIQTGHYLAGFEETAQNVSAGTAVMLRQSSDRSTAADVIDPDGKHALSLAEASKAMSFPLLRDGFYEVQRADRKHLLVAVHADRRESDLTAVPAETLELWRNTGSAGAGSSKEQRQTQSVAWSLGRYVLLIALLLALAESMFGSRYLKASRANRD
jgi:hypothetical protein